MYDNLQLIGFLGADPVYKVTEGGREVASMNVACNRKFTTASGEKKEETIWYRVSVWGKLANIVRDLGKKGALVFVEGALHPDEKGNPRIWSGTDGSPQANYEVTASMVRFLRDYNKPQGSGSEDF